MDIKGSRKSNTDHVCAIFASMSVRAGIKQLKILFQSKKAKVSLTAGTVLTLFGLLSVIFGLGNIPDLWNWVRGVGTKIELTPRALAQSLVAESNVDPGLEREALVDELHRPTRR